MNFDQRVNSLLIELWRIPSPGPENLLSAPAFKKLSELFAEYYAVSKPVFALNNALRSLGLPCTQPLNSQQSMPDFTAIAKELNFAFTRKTTRRRHICPLDLADDFPAMLFGNARIEKFDANTLGELFNVQRLIRHFPSPLQLSRLAQFQWLIVEEVVVLNASPEMRAFPFLSMEVTRDIGEINPHLGRFPATVEDALFFLLLVPWESLSRYSEIDWRGFRIPWIYTLDEDLFISPQRPPSLDNLSLEPWIVHGAWGEEFELERPTVLPLDDSANEDLRKICDTYFMEVQNARKTVLFETPVVHFLVRAFLAQGIDEFIAHLTTIEAAVGLESDYKFKLRTEFDSMPRSSATKRVAARLAALIQDQSAVHGYEELFEVRSAFIHGRAQVPYIPTNKRILARSFARRAVCSLVTLALSSPLDRNECLSTFR